MGSSNGEVNDDNAHGDRLQQPHSDGCDVLHASATGTAHDCTLHRRSNQVFTSSCSQQQNRAVSVQRDRRQVDLHLRLPKIIESDSETGLVGQYAANFAEATGFQWIHRPPRAKAAIVERHHEILPQSLHKTELQMQQEHRELEFNQVLALVIAAKNNLTMIAGVTPHQAVFGRPGHLLPNTEEASVSSDLSTVNRAREAAAASIVEEHAKQRMTRAWRHQTRPAIEEFPYEPRAAVDFYTPQIGKETPTWRGPAQVI
eukprot:5528058-Amphidinium_carterae.3